MQHWITQQHFAFYVGMSSGIRSEADAVNSNIMAGFSREGQALAFALECRDGLNFVMVYNEQGKTVRSFSPSY